VDHMNAETVPRVPGLEALGFVSDLPVGTNRVEVTLTCDLMLPATMYFRINPAGNEDTVFYVSSVKRKGVLVDRAMKGDKVAVRMIAPPDACVEIGTPVYIGPEIGVATDV